MELMWHVLIWGTALTGMAEAKGYRSYSGATTRKIKSVPFPLLPLNLWSDGYDCRGFGSLWSKVGVSGVVAGTSAWFIFRHSTNRVILRNPQKALSTIHASD